MYATIFIPGLETQPSSQPTGQPTAIPLELNFEGPSIFSNKIIDVLLMIVSAVKYCLEEGHLCNILVIQNDDEEAIMVNIRHEDIFYFTRTAADKSCQTVQWLQSTSGEQLQNRFEAHFFDTE